MKKVLLFVIFFISISYGQGKPWNIWESERPWGTGNAFNKSFEPVNLDTNVTQTQVTFIGDRTITKVSKDSGGTRAVAYMRVWRDSTTLVTNGTFDSNTSGWEANGTPTTFLWAADDGGSLTGVAHIVGDGANDGILLVVQPIITGSGYFKLSYDINVISLASTTITSLMAVSGAYDTNTISSTGVTNYSSVVHITASGALNFSIGQTGVGACEFYVDNFSLIPVVDSTYGYTYTFARPADTITYYYSQSVKWIQKDKDTIWVAADPDTVIIPHYNCTIPSFAFTDTNDVELGTFYETSFVVVSDLSDCNPSVSVSPLIYNVGYRIGINGEWGNLPSTVSNEDTVWARVLSINQYSMQNYVILNIGGVLDTMFVTTKAAPASFNANYLITTDGDTLLTTDGDTLKTLGFLQIDFLEQLNNGEKNETDSICNRSVFAVLGERKRTIYA